MVAFIDQHRATYGVEPICALLPIAPSTYFLRKAQQADPTMRSARAQRDDELRAAIQRVWDDNEQVYGPRKVWKQLRREGHRVARCTVERVMRAMGLRGVSRGRAWVVTTRADAEAARPADRVDRQFAATRPNQLWVRRFHLRGDVARLCLCGLCDRRLCPAHRRLARLGVAADRLRPRCA
jgi:putative transposase